MRVKDDIKLLVFIVFLFFRKMGVYDFESGVSTNSTTGALHRRPTATAGCFAVYRQSRHHRQAGAAVNRAIYRSRSPWGQPSEMTGKGAVPQTAYANRQPPQALLPVCHVTREL